MLTNNKISFLSFVASDTDSEDAHDQYRERPWPRLFETTPLFPFFVSSHFAQFGSISVSYVQITGQNWLRDNRHLRQDHVDSLAISISVNIGAKGMAGDKSFDQSYGDAFFYDLAQASQHQSTSGNSILLVLPRQLAQNFGLNVRELHGFSLPSVHMQLLTSYLLGMRKAAASIDMSEGFRIERTIVDILKLTLNASGRLTGALENIGRLAVLERAKFEIQSNLGSSLLKASNLCRRLNISRSTLHRIFEDHGGVSLYIRDQRLLAAQKALLESSASLRIVEIAERFGFADAAHFSRSYRERFGETPSDYRVRMTHSLSPFS